MTVVERIRAGFAGIMLSSETKKNLRKEASGSAELHASRNLEYRSFALGSTGLELVVQFMRMRTMLRSEADATSEFHYRTIPT